MRSAAAAIGKLGEDATPMGKKMNDQLAVLKDSKTAEQAQVTLLTAIAKLIADQGNTKAEKADRKTANAAVAAVGKLTPRAGS